MQSWFGRASIYALPARYEPFGLAALEAALGIGGAGSASLDLNVNALVQLTHAALARVGLTAAAGKRYRAYSQGMRQRLALAACLLAPRDLYILDEPTNGLDPQGTREVRAMVADLARDGATVLFSTHLLSEVEQICTHVGVMHRGRLVTQAPLAQLRGSQRVRVETDQPAEAARVLGELSLTEVEVLPGAATGVLDGLAPEKVVAALVHGGVPVRGFALTRPDLEELFVSLTGEGFDVSG
jgi:lantibiotic transport system ATP-binding protein